MVRRIQPRTPSQWKEEIRRVHRMREAIGLEDICDIGLTANVTDHLDGSATFLRYWLVAKLKYEGRSK